MFKKMFSLEGRVWSASLLNVLALVFQLYALLEVRDATGVSKMMLAIFAYMQVTYAQAGWRAKMWGQFYGMAISAIITVTILILTFVF